MVFEHRYNGRVDRRSRLWAPEHRELLDQFRRNLWFGHRDIWHPLHATPPPAHHSRLLQAASATRLGLRSCSWPRTRTKSAASTNAEPVPGTKRRAQRVPLSVGKLPDQQPAPEFSGGDVAEVLYPGLEASEPLVPREGWILDSAVGCERHRAACGSASAWRSSAG